MVARWAHNPKVAGSSPAPATKGCANAHPNFFIHFYITSMQVVYEDNHVIIVNKAAGEIVQGDKSGDAPLSDAVKAFIKEKYAKPGNVFCGVVHRIDRPVSGLVIFAKTSKALSRLNEMLRKGEIHKTYWALVEGKPEVPEATLAYMPTPPAVTCRSRLCSACRGSWIHMAYPTVVSLWPTQRWLSLYQYLLSRNCARGWLW